MCVLFVVGHPCIVMRSVTALGTLRVTELQCMHNHMRISVLRRVCLLTFRAPPSRARPQAINEKPQVIQEYESGKAIPNPQVLSKLSRALGVVLKK